MVVVFTHTFITGKLSKVLFLFRFTYPLFFLMNKKETQLAIYFLRVNKITLENSHFFEKSY